MKLRIYLFSILLCATVVTHAAERLFILNEGQWGADNGSLTYFADNKVVSNHWFRDVNGYKLGDTPNAIVAVNPNLYAIAVNSSNIIQFIDAEGKAVAATENVPNNRKLVSDGTYVYVTSYAHECETIDGTVSFIRGFVAKIDVATFKVVATCEVGYEPEGIALYNGILFVANSGGYAFQEGHDYEQTVSMVNAATMTKIRDIDTGQINLYGDLSQTGKYLCINSPGDYYETPAATVILDCEAAIEAGDCTRTLPYASTYSTVSTSGQFYAVGSSYSYLSGGYELGFLTIDPAAVFADEADAVLEEIPSFLQEAVEAMKMPYGIYVNPYSGYFYATDAYTNAEGGTLYQWDAKGNYIGEYQLYMNPSHFLALPPSSELTNILTPSSQHDQAAIYNLQGIPVSAPVKGQTYIINGKKTLYK